MDLKNRIFRETKVSFYSQDFILKVFWDKEVGDAYFFFVIIWYYDHFSQVESQLQVESSEVSWYRVWYS